MAAYDSDDGAAVRPHRAPDPADRDHAAGRGCRVLVRRRRGGARLRPPHDGGRHDQRGRRPGRRHRPRDGAAPPGGGGRRLAPHRGRRAERGLAHPHRADGDAGARPAGARPPAARDVAGDLPRRVRRAEDPHRARDRPRLVTVCRHCNHENPDGAAFCNACGNPLERQRVEVRKPVTLIFCDVTGSTELAGRIDAEAVREVLFSCFREVRDAIERHGGTVEKFIGDAVVGVFGVPVAHEDDPLRAARAALEVRAALPALNDDLERRFGARLAVRTGINTGEVVAGDASTRASFVSGDAVNVAARLEQAAAPGQILLGETTYALVHDAVEALPLEPLRLNGKAEPVPCFELVRLREATARAVRAPLLGRDAELAVLAGALADATASGEPRRLLVVGEGGVGKSRLVEEFLAHAGARALTARCLPYGEGITSSPLVQLVRQAAAIGDGSGREEARSRLAGVLAPLEDDAATATAILAQVTGLAEGVASAAEIAWAARRFVEALAAEEPLVVLVDDLQWAEDPLVELLYSIASRARGRVLVLCLARPELERRTDAPPADVHLDALDADAAALLLERLLGPREVDVEERAALLAAAGGNPLFLEELVTFLEGHGAASAIPPTLDALLSAHVDTLDATERPVLERGSIEGEVFHHDGVVALGEGEPAEAVEETLLRLRAQDLVRATQ